MMHFFGLLRASLLISIVALCMAPTSAPAADWPVYGKDTSNSRNGAGDGPSRAQVGSLSQATWKFDTPKGDFTGTPIVAGGELVAGTSGGWIYALDAVTGDVRWSRDAGGLCPAAPNGCINASAAIDTHGPRGGIVFIPIAQPGKPRLLALSLEDGSVLWDTVLTDQAGSDVYGSPVFWNGAVYIGHSADQGDVSTARGGVVALDEASGQVRWHTYTVPAGSDGGPVWSTPAIDAATARMYVGTGNAYHAPAADTTDSMMALDARSGQILGHYQATPDDAFDQSDSPASPDVDFGSSPNLIEGADGRKLVGEGQKSGVYWALDRATLQEAWHTTVGATGNVVGGIVGSTAYDGTRIYGPDSTGGEVWSIGRDGALQWISAEPGPIYFSPVAVSNGVLYTTDFSTFLTARDASNGLILAKLPLGFPTFGGASIVGGAVYAAVGTGKNGSGSVLAFGDTSRSGAGPTPGSDPLQGRCGRKRRFRFSLKRGRGAGGRVVRVDVFLNGRRTLVRRGRNLKRVVLRRLPLRRFTFRIVVTHRDGTKSTRVRRYKACGKTKKPKHHAGAARSAPGRSPAVASR